MNRRSFLKKLAGGAAVAATSSFVLPGQRERYLVKHLGVDAEVSDTPKPGTFYKPTQEDQVRWMVQQWATANDYTYTTVLRV